MKLLKANHHIVTEIEGKNYLIDTGSPISFSFCNDSSIVINEEDYPFSNACLMMIPEGTKQDAEKLTGLTIDGFVGMDIVNETGLTIDYENEEIRFGTPSADELEDDFSFIPFSLSTVLGSYISTNCITLGRKLSNTLIDTGAWVSYLSKRHIDLLKPTGEFYEDEGPEFGGHMEGEYYTGEISLELGDGTSHSHMVKVGKMPGDLDSMGIFDAVIGPELLSEKCVVIDFERKRVWFK